MYNVYYVVIDDKVRVQVLKVIFFNDCMKNKLILSLLRINV